MKKKLDELEIELGTARNRARELERGAHELAVQLEAAFNGVFQGLT